MSVDEPLDDTNSPSRPFADLGPVTLLAMLESIGLEPDGRLLELNSFENRVYQLGLEDQPPVIVKVYRPGRWPDAAIAEEHDFARALAAQEVPVVAPLDCQGASLHHHAGYRFAVYPRRGGHAPALDHPQTLQWLGRLLGQLHNVGASDAFAHRPALDWHWMARQSRDNLLAEGWIPHHLEPAYRSVTEDLLTDIDAAFRRAASWQAIRLHGDFHPGNILWTDAGPHLVDLDDCLSGPAIQDLWMMLSGERAERTGQLSELLVGYEQFRDFDPRELHLLEALRTMRMMRYAAWLARRWQDPAFPAAFVWFDTPRYWEDHILALREQAAAMQEPPLCV